LAKELKYNPHFWRGMIDGDGWIANTNKRYETLLTSASFDLIKKYKNFCEQFFNANSSITENNDSKNTYYTYALYKRCSRELLSAIYQGSSIYLNRKMERAKEYFL
jgi:hypothetical protein